MRTPVWKYVALAAACLAIGIAATAGAARLITGSDIRDGSIGLRDLSRRARAALRGAAGATGPAGAQGAQGTQGPAGTNGAAGAPGTSGSTAPALMMGSTGFPSWAGPIGNSNFGSEGSALTPVPPGTGLTARDFTAAVAVAPGGGNSITITLRLNQVDTALGCTIAGTARTCAPAGDPTLALPSGGLMSMRTTTTGAPAGSTISWGFRVVF